MDAITANMPLLVFIVIGTIAVASSLLVVMMRNPVHSAIFLLITFLCVATLFVMKGAEFVGAVQVLVYAGGIMVLFLFVVMLINVRHLPDEPMATKYAVPGIAVGLAIFVIFAAMVRPGVFHDPIYSARELRSVDTHRTKKTVGSDRQRALHRLPRSLRGRLALPPRRHDRRDRHRKARALRRRRRNGTRLHARARRDRARDQGGVQCLAPPLT